MACSTIIRLPYFIRIAGTGPRESELLRCLLNAAVKADDKSPLSLSLPHRDTQNPVKLKPNLRMATEKEIALITGWSQSLNSKTKTDKI